MPITLLKDGRYRIRYYADGQKTGRRIQETLPYDTTREEAVAFYRKKLAEGAMRRGSLAPAFWTIEGLADDYIASQKHRLAPGSVAAYESSARPIKAHLGKIRLDRLRPADVQRYQKIRSEENLSPHSVNREVRFLKTILGYALAQGWIDRHPLPKGAVKRLPARQNRTRFFSREEWEAFIRVKSMDGTDELDRLSFKTRRRIVHMQPLWWTLLLTGLRIGEAITLRWKDIDLEAGRISLTQEKTGTVKHVPISRALRPILESLPRGTAAAPVFTDFDGSPLLHSAARNTFEHIRAVAGLPQDLLVHSFRHSFASWLASAGVPLHTIGQLLGHTGPGMTARYAHLSDGALVDAVEVMTRVLSGEQAPPIRHPSATVSPFPLKQKDLP